MKVLKAIDRALGKLEEWLCVILLLSILFLAVYQSLARNLFNKGFLWADVLVRQMTFWLGLAGAAVATREGRHINIDVIGRFLSARTRAVVAVVCDLFAVAACLWLVYGGYFQVLSAYAKERTEPVLGPIYSWQLQLSIPFFFGLFALHFLLRMIYGVARLASKGPLEEGPISAHGIVVTPQAEAEPTPGGQR